MASRMPEPLSATVMRTVRSPHLAHCAAGEAKLHRAVLADALQAVHQQVGEDLAQLPADGIDRQIAAIALFDLRLFRPDLALQQIEG